MKGLAELKNKIVKAPHLNIFKNRNMGNNGVICYFFISLYICRR